MIAARPGQGRPPRAWRRRFVSLWVLVLSVVVVALVAAADSRADGDPASDILYTDRVFFPYGDGISSGARHALTTTVSRAERAGYPIKVALIARPFDLGAVTSLWGKPRDYARFLDYELSLVYDGPLLIVMPSGIGFAHYQHPTAREYRTIASLPAPTGPDGLAVAAIKAITAVATKAGHPVSPASISAHQGIASPIKLLGGAVALSFAGLAAFATVRRRRGRDISSATASS